jgi:small subunit ribosomal protein S20
VAIEKIAVLRATPRAAGRGWLEPSADTGLTLRPPPGGTGPRRRYTPRRSMANIHSQKKRIQRAARERLENRRYTSKIRTYFHRLEHAVAGGDEATIDSEHRVLVQTIDKAVKRGAIHRNTGARKKSRAAHVRRGSASA